jgi:hypothetical protein
MSSKAGFGGRQILIKEAYFMIRVKFCEFGNVYLIQREFKFREVLNLGFSDFGVGHSDRAT